MTELYEATRASTVAAATEAAMAYYEEDGLSLYAIQIVF